MSFLKEIVASSRARLTDLPRAVPEPGERGRLAGVLRGRARLSVIAEVKRASPSAGPLRPGADAVARARDYVEGGAAAVSVLTEPTRFGGDLEDLWRVAAAVPVPVLMKDFLIDPEQVRVGRLLGADGVLLIVRLLHGALLDEMVAAAWEWGVDTLVECHDEAELERALGVGAELVGINNRDLDTFKVDTSRAPRLLRGVPAGVVAVAESGYDSPASVRTLEGLCDGVLVGSALMRCEDPAEFLREVCA